MLRGNQLQQKLIQYGLAKQPKERKPKHSRKFTCHSCGKTMYFPEHTNVMSCECGQYYIFDSNEIAPIRGPHNFK